MGVQEAKKQMWSWKITMMKKFTFSFQNFVGECYTETNYKESIIVYLNDKLDKHPNRS